MSCVFPDSSQVRAFDLLSVKLLKHGFLAATAANSLLLQILNRRSCLEFRNAAKYQYQCETVPQLFIWILCVSNSKPHPNPLISFMDCGRYQHRRTIFYLFIPVYSCRDSTDYLQHYSLSEIPGFAQKLLTQIHKYLSLKLKNGHFPP